MSETILMARKDELDAHTASTNPHTGSQPLDALLTAIATLTTAADQIIYSTGSDTVALTALTAFARTLLDDANAAAARTTLDAEQAGTAAAAITTHEGAADPHPQYLTAAEGDAAYQPLDTELTALAGLTSAADKGIQFTGAGTAGTYDLTTAGKALLDDADATAQRTTLGLGTAATENTGTSGNTVPLLDGANTWSAAQTFTTALAVGSGGTGASTAAAARASLGVLGVGLQADNLVVTNGATPTTQVDVDADGLLVYDASGDPILLTAVNVTATITTSGADGLDTGTEASDTWYHVWVIHDGTTTAALLSTSATSPTMPAGYTHKQRVGAVRNNASSDFVLFRQQGRSVAIEEQVVIKDGSFTINAWTAQDVTAFFPPTARRVRVAMNSVGGKMGLSHRSDGFGGEYFRGGVTTGAETWAGVFPTGRTEAASFAIMYASSLYYYVGSADSTMLAAGWEF